MQRLSDIDWIDWVPLQRATILFVVEPGRVLLIHKKRGLGAGKINGPGGRLEAGETPLDCALRETREELGIEALGVRQLGELRFQFVDGLSIHGFVFRADGLRGEPRETEEAIPEWFPLDRIPYASMWADDELWFPHLLAGRRFSGRFLFADDRLLDARVEVEPPVGDGVQLAGNSRRI